MNPSKIASNQPLAVSNFLKTFFLMRRKKKIASESKQHNSKPLVSLFCLRSELKHNPFYQNKISPKCSSASFKKKKKNVTTILDSICWNPLCDSAGSEGKISDAYSAFIRRQWGYQFVANMNSATVHFDNEASVPWSLQHLTFLDVPQAIPAREDALFCAPT